MFPLFECLLTSLVKKCLCNSIDFIRTESGPYLLADIYCIPCALQVTSAKLRLIGSDTTGYISRGYLEVYHNGRWGAICSDGWNDEDSYVACGNLGYPDFKVCLTINHLTK